MRIRKADIKMANRYFGNRKNQIDTVKTAQKEYTNRIDVLEDAFAAWQALDELRRREKRHERYVFGDQWGDRIVKNSRTITERQNIMMQGNAPLQNNRIRNIVRTVVGQFQTNQTEPVCTARDRDDQETSEMMSNTLQYVYQNNKLWGLDTASLYGLLISGFSIFRGEWGRREDRWDVWDDIIELERFFVDNNMKDPRGHDCHLVGALWDMSLNDILGKFAHSPKDRDRILEIYGPLRMRKHHSTTSRYTKNREDINFFIPETNSYRVIEVWRKESKERYECWDTLTGDYFKIDMDEIGQIAMQNQQRIVEYSQQGIAEEDMRLIRTRWFVDNYWYYYFLSPYGEVLSEGETPFWHKSHPFTFKMYPNYNGKVYPFVGDFIDQQRFINRYMMLYDFIIRNSAKGVLVAPREMFDDMSHEELRDEWTRVDGVVLYNGNALKGLPNAKVEQIKNASVPVGITEMIALQTRMLEEVSGVSNALQGQQPKSGTPSSLYLQQSQNSSASLTEIFEAFRELREARDLKNLKLIQQYYTTERNINISGASKSRSITYTPQMVRDLEFEVSITESTSTASYRQVINDMLLQFWSQGAITLKQMLEVGAFPFADKLIQTLETDEEEITAQMESGEGLPQFDQEAVQQAYESANPETMAMLENHLNSEQ